MSTADRGVFNAQRFPPPPPASVTPTEQGTGLPEGPGIYFVWDGPAIVYVGLSRKLKNRATLHHPKICESDRLSFIEFPDEDDLVRVETFYIGVIYPRRNTISKKFPWWRIQ